MIHHHIATGIVVRDGKLLMVASRYPNHSQPLWNLPGGRQLPGELLSETAEREVLEETGVRVEVRELAYLGESFDGEVHFLNATFVCDVVALPFDSLTLAQDKLSAQGDNDHVAEASWVPLAEVGERIAVAVVREPLLAYLNGTLPRRYAGYHRAGVTIEWPEDSQ